MDLIARLTHPPFGAWAFGFAVAVTCGVAVIGLGAPGWILVPASWLGLTALSYLRDFADRHAGGRRL